MAGLKRLIWEKLTDFRSLGVTGYLVLLDRDLDVMTSFTNRKNVCAPVSYNFPLER